MVYAASTPSEYVILITYPLQQRLQARVSMLRYKYIACLVMFVYQHETLRFNLRHFFIAVFTLLFSVTS